MLEQLLENLITQRHRELVIVSGEQAWCWDQVEQMTPLYKKGLILSQSHKHGIWPEHNHQLLGQEYPFAVYDAITGVIPDRLATISGTIKAGGLLIVLLPKLSDLYNLQDEGFYRFQSAAKEPPSRSLFNQYLIHQLNDLPCVLIEQGKAINHNQVTACNNESSISQSELVAQYSQDIVRYQNAPFLITADRGRGKSAALGLIASNLAKQDYTVLLCASQRRAVDSVFKHFATEQSLVLTNKNELGALKYIAPDALIDNMPDCDVLLIDEAATIPVAILKEISCHYKKVIFASTVHGYEGTGRGFTLRFIPYLKSQFKRFRHHHLTKPIRFNENDPLELCINRLLLLDADFATIDSEDLTKLTYSRICQSQLIKQPLLLKSLFALLVTAHYQTTANDLRHLLDSNNLKIYIVQQQQQVIAAAIVSLEGQIDHSLAKQIISAERRPRGHLLAQSIALQTGNINDLEKAYGRIMRIAVHPQLRNLTIGSQLIDYIYDDLSNEIDCLGTSFGAQSNLIKFWQSNAFSLVKVGYKRDKASAEHAAIMIKSTQIEWKNKLMNSFHQQVVHQLTRTYQHLDEDTVLACLQNKEPFVFKEDKDLIARFIANKIQLEQAYSALFRNILISPEILNMLENISRSLLIRLILQNQPPQKCMTYFKISGKKQLQQQLNLAVSQWFDLICIR